MIKSSKIIYNVIYSLQSLEQLLLLVTCTYLSDKLSFLILVRKVVGVEASLSTEFVCRNKGPKYLIVCLP